MSTYRIILRHEGDSQFIAQPFPKFQYSVPTAYQSVTSTANSPGRGKPKRLFQAEDGTDYTRTFILVSSLFLLWGCCNGLIDVLNKHFQNTLHVTKAQSAYVQMANYSAYFLMAIPAGMIARRFGYKKGIITGLSLVAVGSFGFIPATAVGSYGAFLTALFVLATGLTCLETIANPYTIVLGSPAAGATRINLAQFCGGIGWMLGPLIGGLFIFSSTGSINRSNDMVYLPYAFIGSLVTALAVIFSFARVPDLHPKSGLIEGEVRGTSLWAHPHFVWAVIAQFCYVAAQTGIFSFFINYVISDTPRVPGRLADWLPASWSFANDGSLRFSERGASQMLGFGGFGLLLVGRFVGGLLMRRVRAHLMLAWFGISGAMSMALVMLPWGWVSLAGLFLSFFFMSLMFPTIFALGIQGLGEQTKRASSFMIMSIVGGAVMPIFMGRTADHFSMRTAFVMPLACFGMIAIYAVAWPRLKGREVKASEVTAEFL